MKNKMRRKFLVLIALMMTIAMLGFLAGCSSSSDDDGGNENDAGETVELVMGHPFSGQHPISLNILEPFAEALEEESNGRIKLTIIPAAAITSAASVYEDVIAGSFDIGWTLQGYTAGRYPLTEVVELPFIVNSATEGSVALWRLLEQSPDLQDEYSEVKVLSLWVTDTGEIMSKKPVQLPADMAGMRVRFAGPMQETMLTKLGAVPVGMAAPDMYDNLERGIIDGIAIGSSTIESYRLHEVITNATRGLEMFVSPQVLFLNKDKWDSLSSDDQELISRLSGEYMAEKAGEIYDHGLETGFQIAEDGGVEIYAVPEDVKAQWDAVLAPMIGEWTGKDSTHQNVYDLMVQIVEDMRK
ncbi:TRAP transporter substrate-binding protein [Alkalibacter mobilis]|uniref:TRAP transporter substrate-binding protein n=1 Tax=Alkalibacter mobilis TaxID=2787712 RepID=UPI00189CF24D|nr:TRAP transporter substrate-binding protein [Alkalibacter mobilis]MBF7097003.1 TRAP transporter substrate-binding protein [Alkalibacter mobilis]